jgi:hypothetical protein
MTRRCEEEKESWSRKNSGRFSRIQKERSFWMIMRRKEGEKRPWL